MFQRVNKPNNEKDERSEASPEWFIELGTLGAEPSFDDISGGGWTTTAVGVADSTEISAVSAARDKCNLGVVKKYVRARFVVVAGVNARRKQGLAGMTCATTELWMQVRLHLVDCDRDIKTDTKCALKKFQGDFVSYLKSSCIEFNWTGQVQKFEQNFRLPAVIDSAVFVIASAVLWMEEGRLIKRKGRELKVCK